MKRSNILLAFVATGVLAVGTAIAQQSSSSEPRASSSSSSGGQQNMEQRPPMGCSHYMTMKAAGQTAAVDSMRSKMPAANKMASTDQMAKKVAAGCRDHPGMMVHEVMQRVMPRTSVMAH